MCSGNTWSVKRVEDGPDAVSWSLTDRKGVFADAAEKLGGTVVRYETGTNRELLGVVCERDGRQRFYMLDEERHVIVPVAALKLV